MSLVLLVSNNQYLLSNGSYESGLQQWLWLADCLSFRRATVTAHNSPEVAVHSRAPEPLTARAIPHMASLQGRGSKREGKRKMSRTKGLILQMASHRYAKSTGGKSWRSAEFQIFINSPSGPTSDKPTRHERQDYFA